MFARKTSSTFNAYVLSTLSKYMYKKKKKKPYTYRVYSLSLSLLVSTPPVYNTHPSNRQVTSAPSSIARAI